MFIKILASALPMGLGIYLIAVSLLDGRKNKSKWNKLRQNKLKDKRENITGKKSSRYVRFRTQCIDALEGSDSKITWEQFKYIVAACSVAGFGFGALMHNMLLSVIMTVCCAFIPLEVLKIKQSSYQIYMNEQVQSALNIVTNAYLRSENINAAVKENLSRIEPPLQSVFAKFVAGNTFIDSDIVRNIRIMQNSVNNRFFSEWCDTLILCQTNRQLKYVLPTIIESMSDIKNMQEELNTMMYQIYKEYGIVAILVAANVPFMRVLNYDWYAVLTGTAGGRIVVAVVFLVMFISAAYVVRVNKPISVA